MYGTSKTKWWLVAGMAALLTSASANTYDDCCEEETEECTCEQKGPEMHLHFSSQDVDFYEQTPDTVYQDADWPSRVEEYSDYLSH